MPLPGPFARQPNIRYDIPLSNWAVEIWNERVDDIATTLFPEVQATARTGRYYKIPIGAFLGVVDARRASKALAKLVEFQVSSDTYYCEEYALAAENDLAELAEADQPIRLRENSIRLIQGTLRRSREFRIIQMVSSISNVGSGVALSGANKWATNSADVISQVNTARSFIRSRTGFLPNVAVVDYDSLEAVKRNQRLITELRGNQGGLLENEDIRTKVLRVDEMVVAQGIYNTAAEGQDASLSGMWGPNLLLSYRGQATGMQSATFGIRYQWQPSYYPAAMAIKTKVEDRARERNVEVLEAGYCEGEKIVAPELAYLITGLI